jgi:soluble lytic murein transglycosylase-like protein
MSRLVARHLAGALWNVVKGSLMMAGLVALVAWEVNTFSHRPAKAVAVQQDVVPVLEAVKPGSLASETLALADEGDAARAGSAGEHKRIASYLARKYKVAADATQWIVSAAFRAGRDVGVDPLLILAVMGIESRMNPFAESGMGAQGLMQVIPKYHLDKFEELGGPDAVLNPVANIRVGALILKDYLERFGGVEPGLRAYSGATGDDFGYAAKIMAERDRIKAAAGAAKVPAAVKPVRAESRQVEAEPARSADEV